MTSKQPLRRDDVKHVRVAEFLRLVYKQRRVKLKRNPFVAEELIRRKVLRADRHLERDKFGNLVLNPNGHRMVVSAVEIARDLGLAELVDRRHGYYVITERGRRAVEAWFDINSDE